MAVVQGVKEKVHLPIYDSVTVKAQEQLRKAEASSTLRFFIDVQGKTKLETNLQSAGLLPHYNTFEARALRVVLSDLPPRFPDDVKATKDDVEVANGDGKFFNASDGSLQATNDATKAAVANVEIDLSRLMELLAKAREDKDRSVDVEVTDEDRIDITLVDPSGADITSAAKKAIEDAGATMTFTVDDLEGMVKDLDEKEQPPEEQIAPRNGSGNLVSKIIYNTVTTFYVGEKIMIQMPTWFFPAGAGAYSEGASFIANGEPNPTATFRFAEPIFIDRQQNFRVELEIPDADTLKEIQKIYGPLFIWVVLDGYMTRDVQ
jgi:hypothetical protein